MPRPAKAKSKPISGRSVMRGAATKTNAVGEGGVAKGPVMTTSASKGELRARIEKLERANATLRAKNKELHIFAIEAVEQVDALTLQLATSERRAGRQARHEAPKETFETREIVRPGRGKRRIIRPVQGEWEEADVADAGTHGGGGGPNE